MLCIAVGSILRQIVNEHFSGSHPNVGSLRNQQVVSKKKHASGKLFQKLGQKWISAVMTARKELGMKGFCAIGGKSAQGKALYAKAKALYAA